ncbi:MAG TPA: efflux RND transporter periplasmic adaptor subunit [Prolixibacteraceae bacterium]|nr:MAG: efflux transporter periplasmic adaptor subunit [Bacteroidetes bacterium GWB2_41_8]HAQ20043.1 efflux RND transporter periplasmic adaptor subunit [Prolixibacteraceae bacterium]
MKKAIIYIIVAVALIAIVVIRLKTNKETTVNRVYQYDKEQAINVQAITLTLESVKNDISYTGTFEPNKETRISADIQGKINAVLVDVGSVVRKGQALVQLDNSLLKLQLQTVEIQIEGLETDVKRYTVLANADAIQGVQLEKTELALKSAKVQKATIKEQINKTTITAPFDGIVTAKLTEEGAFAAPGIPLLQITDISILKFTVNVPERELSVFEPNQEYALSADAYPETVLLGKVILTGSKANIGNSFPVQFSVNNSADLKIKSGMFGKVLPIANGMKNDDEKKSIIIPASAIIGTNIQPQVYLVKNGKAILQNITTSNRFQNKVQVSSGLTEGDVIITNGFINLFDGANVTISN